MSPLGRHCGAFHGSGIRARYAPHTRSHTHPRARACSPTGRRPTTGGRVVRWKICRGLSRTPALPNDYDDRKEKAASRDVKSSPDRSPPIRLSLAVLASETRLTPGDQFPCRDRKRALSFAIARNPNAITRRGSAALQRRYPRCKLCTAIGRHDVAKVRTTQGRISGGSPD